MPQPLTLENILGGLGNIFSGMNPGSKQAAPPPAPLNNKSKTFSPAPIPPPQSMPEFPVKEIMGSLGSLAGGFGNAFGGLITSENWWVVLLVVFLLFPDFGTNMLGGLFKGSKA